MTHCVTLQLHGDIFYVRLVALVLGGSFCCFSLEFCFVSGSYKDRDYKRDGKADRIEMHDEKPTKNQYKITIYLVEWILNDSNTKMINDLGD